MKRQTQSAALSTVLRCAEAHDLNLPALGLPTRDWRDGWHADKAAKEMYRLKVINALPDGLHERINKRAALYAVLQRYQWGGKVQLIESGRDCDCVEYTHSAGLIDANWAAYSIKHRETSQWADGPFSFTITEPSTEVEAESRDLVMEAYEDGHPHSIVSRFA